MLCIIQWLQAGENQNSIIQKLIKGKGIGLRGQQEMSSFLQDDPTRYTGKQLVEYMMWSSSEKVQKVFAHMPLQAKRVFLKQMNIKEYDWFLLAFTEKQWEQMWQRLPKDQQKIIPCTKLEQLKIMRDTWLESVGIDAWFRKKDSEVRDVIMWRTRAVSVLIQDYMFLRTFPINVAAILFRDSFEQVLRKHNNTVNNIFHNKLLTMLKEL